LGGGGVPRGGKLALVGGGGGATPPFPGAGLAALAYALWVAARCAASLGRAHGAEFVRNGPVMQ
jgi:hypothetical protein